MSVPADVRGPTLDDIARAAGVSKATASKAMAEVPGRYRISPATVLRVQAAARTLGWIRPVGTRKGRIALVYGDRFPLLDGINADIHRALVSRIIESGLEVIYQSMDRGSRNGRLRTLERVDGCLFIMRMPSQLPDWEPWLEEMRHFPPCVLVNAGLTLPHVQVEPDDAEGAQLLFAHLLALGHRRLAVCGPVRVASQHASMLVRHRTLKICAAEAGVELIDLTDRDFAEIPALLVRVGSPTALIALSGWNITRVCCHLLRAGLDWPTHLTLAACDDPPANHLADPPITGVSWSMDQLVNEAFRLLEQAIGGATDPVRVLVPMRVVPRASAAPPAKLK